MKKNLENTEKTITVRQIKSVARRPAIQNEYLKGLGLGKMTRFAFYVIHLVFVVY